MTKTFSLLEFVAAIPAIDRDVQAIGPKVIEQACKIIQARAKKTIGSNQLSWAPLAESTIRDKQAHGYATPKPLLRSGQLRDSIEFVVRGNEGAVGSDDPVALWQELGTRHIPSRSFLVSSAISSEDKIRRLAAAATVAALAGGGHNAGELRELFHLLRELGHVWQEIAEDLLDHDDEESDR